MAAALRLLMEEANMVFAVPKQESASNHSRYFDKHRKRNHSNLKKEISTVLPTVICQVSQLKFKYFYT